MGSVTDELLAGSAPAQASASSRAGSITEEMLGAPQVPNYGGERPEPINKGGRTVSLGDQFKVGFRSDEAEGMRFYASKLFPDEPVEEAVKRFSVTPQDQIVYRADDGKMYEADPSGGLRGFAGHAATKVGEMIPMTASTIAGVTTAPMASTGVGLAGSMAATGAAGAGGEYVRQKLGDAMMGDAATDDVNVGSVVKEGAMAGLGQGIGVGAGRVLERNQVRDIDRLSHEYMDKAYGEAEKRGIKLTPGQATGLKTIQAQEKRLATRVPETIDQMDDFLAQQSGDVQNAWFKSLDDIAPSKDASEVGFQVRKAAQSALDDVTKVRKDAAKPLYEAWAKGSGPVDTGVVLDGVEGEMKTAARGGATSHALEAVKGFLTETDGKPVTDPVKLHNARIEIGNMIDTRSVKGTSINNTIVGKLKGVQDTLTRAMDDASQVDGGLPLYKQARSSFSELSGDVDDAFASSLKRIADLNDTNILAATREAFNPNTRSPEMIRKLGAKLSAKDPEAWQSLKRLWLQDDVADKLTRAQSGDVINPAGKILKILDNPSMRRSIDATLNGTEKTNMNDLKFVLNRIARANLSMGSDTAANQAADRLALERAMPIWAKAQRALGNFWDIPKHVADSAAERNMSRQSQKLVNIVTSGDKNALKAIKDLRKLSPNQWRALAASGQLGLRGATSAVGYALAPRPPTSNTPDAQAN